MTTTKRPDGGELKPCPFCRVSDQIEIDHNPYDTWWIMCDNCGCEKNDLPSRQAAIEWWNTRTPTNESPAPQADATANDIADALERSTQSMARECKVGMGLWNGHSNACLNAVALLRKASVSPAPQPPVEGLRELFRELIAYRENYRPTWATALPNLSWEQFDIILAALASPSLTAESSAQYRKAVDDLNRMNDKGEVAPTTLIEQSGQKRRER